MKKKKVTFIVTRVFWPSNSGSKVILYNYCKGLYDLYGCEINLFVFPEAGQTYEKAIQSKPYFINNIVFAEEISLKNKIHNFVLKTLIHGFPLQCSLYYSSYNVEKIRNFLYSNTPDVLMIDKVRLAEYIKSLDREKYTTVLDFEDLMSKRYKRQIEELKYNKGNIAGVYAGKLPKFINKIIDNDILKRIILNFESNLMKKYELEISNYFDYSIFVSKIEANEFKRTKTRSKVLSITMGINSYFLKYKNSSVKKDNYISYIGNYNSTANQDSIKVICEDIMPLILEKNPHVVLKAVGPCPDEIKNKYSSKHIYFTGEVDNIVTELGETNVFLGYIKYGTGIKTKILEASAIGLPVVTNSVGIEGINLKDGEEIIVRDNLQDIADMVLKLLKDEKFSESVVSKARKKLEEEYKWENILLGFEEIIGGKTNEKSINNWD